jgi:hypothetical protein
MNFLIKALTVLLEARIIPEESFPLLVCYSLGLIDVLDVQLPIFALQQQLLLLAELSQKQLLVLLLIAPGPFF